MLTVENLEASYGDVRALDGVSLEVAEGAIVAIVGANGAGKTTLLKSIAGLLRPQRGEIAFNGSRIDGVDAPDRVRAGRRGRIRRTRRSSRAGVSCRWRSCPRTSPRRSATTTWSSSTRRSRPRASG